MKNKQKPQKIGRGLDQLIPSLNDISMTMTANKIMWEIENMDNEERIKLLEMINEKFFIT